MQGARRWGDRHHSEEGSKLERGGDVGREPGHTTAASSATEEGCGVSVRLSSEPACGRGLGSLDGLRWLWVPLE